MTTNRESALYYLVWHTGLSIEKAEMVLDIMPGEIERLAVLGREGFAKCAAGLCRLIDAWERDKDYARFSS